MSHGSPERGDSQGQGREEKVIPLVGTLWGFVCFYVANTSAILLQRGVGGRQTKQNKAGILAGTGVTQSGKRMRPKDSASPLSGLSLSTWPEFMTPRPPFQDVGLSLCCWGADPTSGKAQVDSEMSWHLPHKAPKEHLTHTCLKDHLSVCFLSQVVCLKALFLVTTMAMKNSTYPDRTVRLSKVM